MKFIRINQVICNSRFTKSVIDHEYGVKSIVLYPPVDVDKFKPLRKKNVILYVGRFSQLEQSKNQHILIEVFRELYVRSAKEWKLILAGGADIGVGNYIEKLGKRIEHFPIEIIQSPTFSVLKQLYGESKIFWSASGYGIDETKSPRKTEHFGITVVEAMAGGAVPFAYNAGGHKETITDGENGFLWDTEDELLIKTKSLIENNGNKSMRELSLLAQKTSKLYGYDRFEAHIAELLGVGN